MVAAGGQVRDGRPPGAGHPAGHRQSDAPSPDQSAGVHHQSGTGGRRPLAGDGAPAVGTTGRLFVVCLLGV